MSIEQAASTAPALPSASATRDATGAADGLTLAGLIDVLDRADDPRVRSGSRSGPRSGPRSGSRSGRSAGYRTPGVRTVADRWDPMRTTGPRTEPGAGPRAITVRPVPHAPATRLPAAPLAARGVAAGPGPVPAARAAAKSVSPVPLSSVPLSPRPPVTLQIVWGRARGCLRSVVRGVALWGAGPDGAYLAWGAPPRRSYRPGVPARRDVDPPVVLREMPSTPTIRPAAPSPAAAPGTAAPVGRGERLTALSEPGHERPLGAASTLVRPAAAGAARSSGPPSGRVPAARAVGLSARTSVPARARGPDLPGGIRGSPDRPPARGSPAARPSTA